ncbi:hypothetical protein IFR04_006870 [Cadophora malorum]|uniref:Uncharacterized protein n=1 Tax=Cadophora malorum TaxID=108018 RepID=A0A8H7TEC4_9HELO|nr:hypothetical protein IFR04_006870 [Cadophora malorum]
MRLLHAKDLKLHSFSGSDIPPYAILSHRWGESEVVSQDLQSGNGIEIARANLKVAGCCAKAMEDGYEYVELLAPDMIVFCDRAWIDIGTKATLESAIKAATNITQLFHFSEVCIAQKMSWAAKRTTTRVEDEAYCLMGIFGVNMPILLWRRNIIRLDLKGVPVVPFEMTNKGLRIRLQLTPTGVSDSPTEASEPEYLASLRCRRQSSMDPVAIRLRSYIDSPDTFYRTQSEHAHFETKSHQGVAWAVLRKDDSGLVLGMTFENSRPGIQVYEVADLDTQRALPELSTRPPMGRVRISLSVLHALQVSIRKITNRGREALPQYRVSLTVIKLGDEGPSI